MPMSLHLKTTVAKRESLPTALFLSSLKNSLVVPEKLCEGLFFRAELEGVLWYALQGSYG